MFLLDLDGIVGLLLFALWLYCIIDVIATDGGMCRNLPKGVWLVLVIMLPDVGSIAWLLLGRPERAGWRPGDTTYRKPFSTRFVVRGPDDDPSFTARSAPTPSRPATPPAELSPSTDARRMELEAREAEVRKAELDAWEADLAKREAELKKKDSDEGGMYGGGRS